MEQRHQSGPGLRNCRPWQPTAWQTCSRKFRCLNTDPLSLRHRGSRCQPTTSRWIAFAKVIGIALAFFSKNALWDCHLRTQQTSRRQPPPDTTNIEKAHQELCDSHYLRLSNRSHVAFARTTWHAGTESARPFIAPSSEHQRDWFSQSRFVSIFAVIPKKQKHCEETAHSMDFSHSSLKAWSAINRLTGRCGHSFLLWPVSSNSIASQHAKIEAHKTVSRRSTRLVSKQVSDP